MKNRFLSNLFGDTEKKMDKKLINLLKEINVKVNEGTQLTQGEFKTALHSIGKKLNTNRDEIKEHVTQQMAPYLQHLQDKEQHIASLEQELKETSEQKDKYYRAAVKLKAEKEELEQEKKENQIILQNLAPNEVYNKNSIILQKMIEVAKTSAVFAALLHDMKINTQVSMPQENAANVFLFLSYTKENYFASFYRNFFMSYFKPESSHNITKEEKEFYDFLNQYEEVSIVIPTQGDIIADSKIKCRPLKGNNNSEIKQVLCPGTKELKALVIGE